MATYYKWRRSTINYFATESGTTTSIPGISAGSRLYTSTFGVTDPNSLIENGMFYLPGTKSLPDEVYTDQYYGAAERTSEAYTPSSHTNIDYSGELATGYFRRFVVSTSPGTSQGYVYSTSSSAYPNGGVSGSYYYDQRTTVTSPTAPSGLTYPNPSRPPSVTVSWTAATSNTSYPVSSYEVSYATNGGSSWTVAGTTKSTSLSVSIPDGATSIQFRVRARDSNGQWGSYVTGETVATNLPPTAPGSITVPTVAVGQPCAVTWTAATDPDGTIATYTLERSVNESGWTQIFSGNALTYTDTIGSDWGTVAYRVCAVDNYGMSGPYATSETQTVQDGILYISGPASAMGSKVAPFAFEISTGVSGSQAAVSDIAVEISLDGNQIYSGTVDTGEEISVTIDTRTIGGGSHTIEATASKTDYVAANETYTFTTPSLSLPAGGLGVQLQDDQGRAVFPQSVAALIAGLNGKSIAGNLQDLLSTVADLVANKVQLENGSYVGTGAYGQNNPNTLTFSFEPKAVFIGGGDNASISWVRKWENPIITNISEQTDHLYMTWNGTSISWYGTMNAYRQLNGVSSTYYYIALG